MALCANRFSFSLNPVVITGGRPGQRAQRTRAKRIGSLAGADPDLYRRGIWREDYFVANPQALGKDSSARRVVAAFLVGINDVDFAEGESIDVVGDVLMAALKVLGDNATLVSNDTRIHVLLGGVTDALRNDLKEAGKSQLGQSLADEIKTEERLVPQDHPIRKAMEAIRLQ